MHRPAHQPYPKRARAAARPNCTWAALAWAACGLFTALPVAAQTSPYYVSGSVAATHDSNLFRLADDQVPSPNSTRSDTVLSTAVAGGFNQGIGRQRVYGSLTLRDNRFQSNDLYSNHSYNGSAGLDWSMIERISGTLSVNAALALSPFNADGVGLLTQKNLETTQAANTLVRIGVVTEYSVEVGAGLRRVRNSLDLERVRARDFNQDNYSVALAWRPGGALSLVGALRVLNGEYPTFREGAGGAVVSDRFKQQQVELATTWQPRGASSLDLRLNFGDTRYVSNEDRNFSSLTGSFGWLWQATGKLRLNTRYTRDEGQDAYPSSIPFFFTSIPVTLVDNRVVSTLRVQGDLDVSGKVALSASAQVARRDLKRDTVTVFAPTSLGQNEGRDSTTLLTMGVRWAPSRSALLGCDASTERRSASGELSTALRVSTLTCYGQLTLQ